MKPYNLLSWALVHTKQLLLVGIYERCVFGANLCFVWNCWEVDTETLTLPLVLTEQGQIIDPASD